MLGGVEEDREVVRAEPLASERSPSRVACAATACSIVARSATWSEKLQVTAQPFRFGAISSRSRQGTPRSSCPRRSLTTVIALRTVRASRSCTSAALTQPRASSLRVGRANAPDLVGGDAGHPVVVLHWVGQVADAAEFGHRLGDVVGELGQRLRCADADAGRDARPGPHRLAHVAGERHPVPHAHVTL